MMSRHEQGNVVLQEIATEFGIESWRLRSLAAHELEREHREMGWTDGDIGSSDVSIKLSSMCLHEVDTVRTEAERLRDQDTLVARVAGHTGKSHAETLDLLRRMFEPA